MTGVGLTLPMVSYSLNADASTLAMGGPELNGVMLPGPKVMAASWLPDTDPQRLSWSTSSTVTRPNTIMHPVKSMPAPRTVSAGSPLG